MNAPLALLKTSHTSGVTPDGRTVPLAWDANSGKLMMKTAPYMPWGGSNADKSKLKKVLETSGQFLADPEEWYRGVWEPAPENILDADYTRNQQQRALRGGSAPLLSSGGGGYAGGYRDQVASTIEDEDEDELTEPPDGEAEEPPADENETPTYSAAGEHRDRVIIARTKKVKDKKRARR